MEQVVLSLIISHTGCLKKDLILLFFFGNGVIRVSHECLGSSKGENVRMVFQRCFDGVPSSRMF